MANHCDNALKEQTTLIEIEDFGELPVFAECTTFPAIMLTKNLSGVTQQFLYGHRSNDSITFSLTLCQVITRLRA